MISIFGGAMQAMPFKRTAISAMLFLLFAVHPAVAQSLDVQDHAACTSIGASPGTVDYRECRLLKSQTRSQDRFVAQSAVVRLLSLQDQLFARLRDKEKTAGHEDLPDLSAYGTQVETIPQPRKPRSNLNCTTMNLGDGMTATDCF
jgi:hypothetical protein